MHIVDYFVIAGYFALVMYLGYYSMKKVSNFDDYAVAGRSMPLPIFFAAIAATLCGGGATIGRISFMHTTGIIVFFALTGVVINQIFSGLFISGRVHNAGKNVYSLGDLYGIYYGRSGRLLSSVFGFLFCVGAFGVQILAMGAILQPATGISLIPAALIASIVTLAYTWSGGILAVTLTDAVQYVIIVIGVTLCAYLAIHHLGGFDAMMSILYSNPRFETNMKLSENPVEKLAFEFLNQAETTFETKEMLFRRIRVGKSLKVFLSELQAMEIDGEIKGALVEILTA